jgi:lipid-A-disaccharide synthase
MTDSTEKKFLIVAGEASGDLHGGHLVTHMKALNPNCRFFGIGGKRMREAGVTTFFDIAKMGTVGVLEAFAEMPLYLKVYRTLVREIRTGQYTAIILIDYPTLNLLLAKKSKTAGCPVFYFISPQIWAWHKSRIRKIRETVTRMFVVLPFEKELYDRAGVDAEFLGHPFSDQVKLSMTREEGFEKFGLQPGRKTIGLLPGSRQSEIDSLLPVMLEAAEKIQKQIPDCQFILPVAGTINSDCIRSRLVDRPLEVRIVEGNSYDVMHCCDFLIIASGSATLEAGILKRPMVIVYKLKRITYWLAKLLVETKMIGLVNIVAGKKLVPELIQGQVTADNIARESMLILNDPERYQEVQKEMQKLQQALGEPGVMRRVAQSIFDRLRNQPDHEKISF